MTDSLRLFLQYLSRTVGWIYTLSWSASFYPQPLLNWQRRSTEGATTDFPFLNVVGFASYNISTIALLFSSTIRAEYAQRHPRSPEPTVQFNDFAYGVHALIIVSITFSQFVPGLWGFYVPTSQRVSRSIKVVTLMCIAMVLTVIGLVLLQGHTQGSGQAAHAWNWLDVVYAIGDVKLIATFFKYVPQVILNYRRQSTVGWSIQQVLLDAIGGVLSLAQLIIDSSLQDDWSGIVGNPVKFGLSNISICFDCIFIVQHYVLYCDHSEIKLDHESTINDDDGNSDTNKTDETRPLLSPA